MEDWHSLTWVWSYDNPDTTLPMKEEKYWLMGWSTRTEPYR